MKMVAPAVFGPHRRHAKRHEFQRENCRTNYKFMAEVPYIAKTAPFLLVDLFLRLCGRLYFFGTQLVEKCG